MTRSVIQLGGQALKLDADGDTTIQVSSDDVLVVDTAGNEALKIDASGQILEPLQCYFHVTKNADQSDFAVGSQVDVTFETEIKDIGSNFASNTFTAPVTGTYALYLSMRVDNIETAAGYYAANINTSNRQYRWIEHFNTSGGDYNYFTMQLFAIADMDASDTAACQIYQHSSTQQSDIKNDTSRTYFQGYLLG
jgi:hypothetical protein